MNNTMILTMTPTQAYQRKQRMFRAFMEWQKRVIRGFFPNTGGSSHLMHNWYRCAEKTNPVSAKLADWIEDSTWARYRRMEAILEKRETQREHIHHTTCRAPFRPFWCPICHPKN